ncbi:DUF4352 domain-containing protein [Clostridium tagluense]|uniref:DUF4352 domain-containing protein n=1 Tax=Clostridium tagluense TaxID=360422 RepID=UPI00209A99D2|nr:DUF4352 domain-containing protein [Clostridium tagluense]
MSKMVNCKACNKEIAKGVNKCVHCGKDQRNFFSKHKFLTGICAVVLLAGIGVAGHDKPTLVKPNDTAVKTSTAVAEKVVATETKSKEAKAFKVGDTVKLTNLQVKVNKVSIVKGDEYTKPAEGNEFFAVDCTVENISQKEQAISSVMMFKVVDKDGRAYEMSITGMVVAKAGQLDGSIGVGRKISGAYVVEVPKGTKGLELVFDASLFSSGQVIVKLN